MRPTPLYAHIASALDEVCADIEAGATPRAAIVAAFHGSLQLAMLRAVHEAPGTRDEISGAGRMVYQPVAKSS